MFRVAMTCLAFKEIQVSSSLSLLLGRSLLPCRCVCKPLFSATESRTLALGRQYDRESIMATRSMHGIMNSM